MKEQHSKFITKKLPLDSQGYTQSFNINDFDPETVGKFYDDFGFVIFDGVLNSEEIEHSIKDLWDDIIEDSKGKIKVDDAQTWNFQGYLGRFGFINDQPLSRPQIWKNRSHPNVYKAFKRLYEITSKQDIKEPILAVFDRASILRPSKLNPNWRSSPIYHFDIHPWWWVELQQDQGERWRRENMYNQGFKYWLGQGNYVPKVRNFTKLQGVLAFSNTGPVSGGFQCVCGFQNYIKEWCIKNPKGTHITRSKELLANFQKCYQRAGSLLVFSRELPHNIYPNDSQNFRYAQYLRLAPQSTLMLTSEQKAVRKEEVKKMLPAYYDVSNAICRQIYMLQEEKKPNEKVNESNKATCEVYE